MATRSPLDDERLTLVGLLLESSAALSRTLERRLLESAGISAQRFEVLMRLARTPGHRLRMTDLATQITLTPSGLTRAIDRLAEEGLVCREACPHDRRSAFAVLTPAGLERVTRAMPDHVSDIADILDDTLSTQERRQLEGLLRKLRDRVNPSATAGSDGT